MMQQCLIDPSKSLPQQQLDEKEEVNEMGGGKRCKIQPDGRLVVLRDLLEQCLRDMETSHAYSGRLIASPHPLYIIHSASS